MNTEKLEEEKIKFITELMEKRNNVINEPDLLKKSSVLEKMRLDLRNFVKIVLKDNERVKEIDNIKNIQVFRLGIPKEDWSKELLKKKSIALKNILYGVKGEIKMRSSFQEEIKKIDKIDKELKNTKKESERRANVANSKFYGAVIELLDIQRKELKKKDELTKTLVKIDNKLDALLNLKQLEKEEEDKEK